MSVEEKPFEEPNAIERSFNRLWGSLSGAGLGFRHSYLLQVRGRKSGRMYSTPVNLLGHRGKFFLVAPRGRTQWVRNAEASGEVILKRGRSAEHFRLRPIAIEDRGEVLKAYLDNFRRSVQRYFPIPAGSPEDRFRDIADRYPVFEVVKAGSESGT